MQDELSEIEPGELSAQLEIVPLIRVLVAIKFLSRKIKIKIN